MPVKATSLNYRWTKILKFVQKEKLNNISGDIDMVYMIFQLAGFVKDGLIKSGILFKVKAWVKNQISTL